jgi:hypothetical protein
MIPRVDLALFVAIAAMVVAEWALVGMLRP